MNDDWETLRRIIRERRTEKVFAAPDKATAIPPEALQQFESVVWQSLIDAGWAPFHFDRRHQGLAEPWRVYWIDCPSCRHLAARLEQWIPDLNPGNKLASMLSACGGVALFTWLPEGDEDDPRRMEAKIRQVNNEHLSATAAAIQNFLLLCTSAGLKTYWGSGSLFEQHLFHRLGIGNSGVTERLAGAVFVSCPPEGSGNVAVAGGAQREKRSSSAAWLHRLQIS
jgi:nitroreductase